MSPLQRLGPGLNAFTLSFADHLLDGLRASYFRDLAPFLNQPENQHLFAGGFYFAQPIVPPEPAYYLFSYDTYPLLWFTSHSARSFGVYKRFFEELKLSEAFCEHVDHHQRLVMYSGFLVVGKQAPECMWHDDYRPGAQAYTLITPLFDWLPGHGHLLYQPQPQQVETYTYALNQALIFGDRFLHSTEPYAPSEQPRVLVSLTFGSDKWAHWPLLRQNIAEQSDYYALPCGHIVGNCRCEHSLLERRLRRWLKL